MTEETDYAGTFVKTRNPQILKDLDAKGLLFDAPMFEHDYPFCWRCDTPLIYYARESLVHQDDGGQGRHDPQQQHHQLDSGIHRKKDVSATG